MPAPYACSPEGSRGRFHHEPDSPTRSPFQRDRDRIIHCGAFRKLEYKTQVFVYHVGDYYRTRLTHSLEVAQITRSICRCLALNEDLAEAVALAHDLGHTPFGHAGEDALDRAMAAYGGFRHNDQTLRVLTYLEQRYADFDGLNLTWETLEGVVKHNGRLLPLADGDALPPAIAAVDAGWSLALGDHAGAEAQVAALADDIAYVTHDIDDGVRAGLFALADLTPLPLIGGIFASLQERYPGLQRRRLVHEAVRRLVDAMVTDLLAETRSRIDRLAPRSPDDIRAADRPVVAFSSAMGACTVALRGFLFERMYRHYQVNRETSKAKRIVEDLFGLFMAQPNTLPTEWHAQVVDRPEGERARVVADYIAGMTDRYAVIEHQRLFDPYPRA